MTRTLRAITGDADGGGPLPHNITAEQAVLGAAMLSPAALAEIRDLLDGSEFYRPAHQVIWHAITTLADRGDPHDPLSVGACLGPAGLAKSGGAPYLHTLIAAVPSTANGAYCAHIVRDLAYARDVLAALLPTLEPILGRDHRMTLTTRRLLDLTREELRILTRDD